MSSAGGGPGLVQKTVQILRTVSEYPRGIGLSDLSRQTGIPKATCLRVLLVLQDEQLIGLDDDTKRYRIALGALAIVASLLDPGGAQRVVASELETLAAVTQETAGLDILTGTDVRVIAQVTGPQIIGQTAKPVPRSLPSWATSTGKVLLAALDPAELEAVHGSALKSAAKSRGSKTSFREELDEVRISGYGVARDEMEAGAAAVAAPVWIGGTVKAAVWIGGPSFRLTEDRIAELAETVANCGKRLGEVLTRLGAGAVTGFGRETSA